MEIGKLVLSDEALNAIDNGVWVDDLPGASGVAVLVRGWQSEPAREARKQKQQAAREKNNGKPLSEDAYERISREVLAEVVLKGWRGLTSDGEPVEYDRQKASEWILSRNGDRFASLVLYAAQSVDEKAGDFVSEATKN